MISHPVVPVGHHADIECFFFVSFSLFDCLFVLNVPTTAKVISRWGHSLNSHLTD